MPEPTPDHQRVAPSYPAGDNARGVSKEANDDIGYGPEDPETNRKLEELAQRSRGDQPAEPLTKVEQQAINEQGAQQGRALTPDGQREARLIAERESGRTLNTEERQFLAKMRARRENRGR